MTPIKIYDRNGWQLHSVGHGWGYMFTLADCDDIDHGELLNQIDIDFANEQLARGESYSHVLSRLHGWASDYHFEQWAETQAARDFADMAYGRD